MYTVVAQRNVPLPPVELWDWLTKPELLGRWFADGGAARLDQDVRFDFGDGDFFSGRVTEWDPGITLGMRWKFVGLGPSYDVRFSLLRRKTGTELSIQDRGAITTEEAECLRVGWSEFLLRLEKAMTRDCSTRFSWRKALSFTGCVNGNRPAVSASLRNPAWLQAALDGVRADFVELQEESVSARLASPDSRWCGAVTDLGIRIRQIRGREYLFLSHEGWSRLPGPLAPVERRRFVALWRGALASLGVS